MYQSINLLPKLKELPKQKFSVDVMFLGLIGWVLLLALVSGILFWMSAANKKDIVKLEALKQTTTQQLTSVKTELNKYVIDEKAQSDSNAQLARVEQMLAAVQAQQKASAATMSQYLKGLAEHTPEGVWLETISIMPAQKKIELKGKAIRSSLIPDFINAVDDAPSFDGAVFNQLHVSKSTDEKQQPFVSFDLNTDKSSTEVKE